MSSSSDSENNKNDEDHLLYNFTHEPVNEMMYVPKTSPIKRQRCSSSSCTTADEEPILQLAERTIFIAGRPPWFDSLGQLKEAFVIGICGGSASGKTSVAGAVIEGLDVPWVSLLCMDSFYKALSQEEHKLAMQNEYNFDRPDSFNLELIAETLKRIKKGKSVEIPIYNFTTHTLESTKKTIYGANVVIFEGIFSFLENFRELMDMKIFVDTDADVRLARRLQRDILERNRDVEGVLKQYNKFVKPAYDMYIDEFRRHADIIVPKGRENKIGINLIISHINQRLAERGLQSQTELKKSNCMNKMIGNPKSLCIVTTPKSDDLFRTISDWGERYTTNIKTLMNILIKQALETIKNSHSGDSNHMQALKICGVSILKARKTLEMAFTEMCNGSSGRILVIVNKTTKVTELHHIRLPKNIKEHKVLLMDASTKTGAAAIMAIRVLLDHEVPEENIILLSIIMASSSVQSIAYAFPNLKIFTHGITHETNDIRFKLLLEPEKTETLKDS